MPLLIKYIWKHICKLKERRVVCPCHSSKTSSTHDNRRTRLMKAWFGQDTELDNRFSEWDLNRRESKSFVGWTELLQVASSDMEQHMTPLVVE
jgi:hypothetical protein